MNGVRLMRNANVFVPVTVRAGAVWRLRRATSIDVGIAQHRAANDLMGVVSGSNQLALLQDTFGDMFDLGDEVDSDRLAAVTQFLGDVHLAMLCSDGWSNLFDDDGNRIDAPSLGAIALLLQDPTTTQRVRAVLYESLIEEHDEKNVSAASPNGGAAMDSDTAPIAGGPGSPAAEAGADISASAVPNSSTHH